MATTQAEFQRQLDAAAWRNVIVNVPEGGVDVYDEPLKAHGCVIAGRLPFATPHPVRGRADIRLHASARPGVLLKGPGAGLFNCLIDYPDNGTDFPLPAPPAVRAITGGCSIRDVVLCGAYNGLRLEDAGHTEVIGFCAQVFNEGIRLTGANDVARLKQIHLWPNTTTRRDVLRQAYYPPGNGRGIIIENSTWVHLDDVFVGWAHVGLQLLGRGPQAASGVSITAGTIQIDACTVGVDAYDIAANDVIMINALKVAGNTSDGASPLTGMILRGSDGDVQIGQYHLHGEVAFDWQLEGGFPRNRLMIGTMLRR